MRHESRVSHYRVVNRPLSATDINRAPSVLFDDAEKAQNILASVEQPKTPERQELINAISWNIIFPINQNVREEDADTTHVMIAPRRADFVTIQDMSEEQLEVGARVICKFLHQERAIAGYNTSNDDRSRKRHSQSWNNFHAHLLRLPEALPEIPTPKNMREPGYWHIGEALTKYATKQLSQEDTQPLQNKEQQEPLTGPGTAVFTLPDVTPEALASFMLRMDTIYRAFHRDLFGAFVSNYDQVAESGWKKPYVLRERANIKTQLPPDHKWLHHLTRVLQGDEADLPADKKIYRSHSYSVGMYIKEQTLHFALQPHFLRATGWMEALGIKLQREEGDVSWEERKTRAQRILPLILEQ